MGAKRGFDKYLYRNTGSYNSPVWNLIDNVRDLTLPLNKGKGDASRRTSNVKQYMPTMHDPEFTWEMVDDPADADLIALQDAWLADTLVEFAFADGPIATSGTQYRRYECVITEISESEPLDDVSMVSVKACPTYTSNAQGTRTTV